MGNAKSFQVILIGICLVCALGGMLVFALGNKSKQAGDTGAPVVIWGTQDEKTMNAALTSFDTANFHYINAIYVQKDVDTFNQDLLVALADGKGPDVILMDPMDATLDRQRVYTIPFKSYTERMFQDKFTEEGGLFRITNGYIALPFTVDPLVMYWNRDLLTTKNIAKPPTTWDQMLSLVPTLADVTNTLQVNKPAVALGGYSNITNAKEIFTALMLQSGSPITTLSYDENMKRDLLVSSFNTIPIGKSISASKSALDFYTQFGNPTSIVYTWNPSLPDSTNEFISNDLSFYFGYGSDVKMIRQKNPNLNFDMALFPQSKDAAVPVTYGKLNGLAILSTSKNIQGAYNAIIKMTGDDFIKKYTQASGLAPVNRSLLANPPSDAYSAIVYKSALYSKSFLDPNPIKTGKIFQEMVESSLSQRNTSDSIIQNASRQFDLLLQDTNQ